MDIIVEWLGENETLLWFLGSFSAVSVVAAIVFTPWAISLMSADYFMPDRIRGRDSAGQPVRRWTGLILKNMAGSVLVVLGVALLALPGQGLLTILAGLVLMNFPGKRSLELWMIRLPMVLRAANWLRQRSGKEPLQVPPT